MSAFDYCKNFKMREFECSCGCGSVKGVNERLLYALQYTRSLYGTSVNVICGGRCKNKNGSLPNSIPNSDHLPDTEGITHAADIQIPGHCETLAKRKIIMKELSKHPGFKYAYCNGAMLKSGKEMYGYSAPLMGKSIHVSFY